MATFQKALLAAIVKSLLRGKSLIQAILNYWSIPITLKERTTSTANTLKPIEDFLNEAETAFLDPLRGDGLVDFSQALKRQFLERLQINAECMLPSFSHQLPSGKETGQYLALDVGGSTLRVALVELRGRGAEEKAACEIIESRKFAIDTAVKDLEGMKFFDWMAARINETLSGGLNKGHDPANPLPMALAWSFPIEQTSLGAGKLGPMGKGFLANKGLLGQDLGDVLTRACAAAGLTVEVEAIINDSSACLLSQAYSHPSTRFGLILGTGLNIAVYLPVHTIGKQKFGSRSVQWFSEASHVIVNTELGMFGHGILPRTKWDDHLRNGHAQPDFQPLEQLVSGMYLGEIARFALIDAIETTGIFGGIVPKSITTPYALGTDTLSLVQGDASRDMQQAISIFSERHPSSHTPTATDMSALKSLASLVATRSSALTASCVHALWQIRLEGQKTYLESLPPSSPLLAGAEMDHSMPNTVVSFNGSVIEHYPGYLNTCQGYVDELLRSGSAAEGKSIELVLAKESSLLGAAVASACVVKES